MQIYNIEDLSVGMQAHLERHVMESDVHAFAEITGDHNPVHLDDAFANSSFFKGRIAHGMLTAGFISAVLGTQLPGPGVIYMSQTLRFLAPVRAGDVVLTTLTISTIDVVKKRAQLHCQCCVGDKVVVEGEALVFLPAKPV